MTETGVDLIRSVFGGRCDQRRWVAWREEPHKVTRKPTKVPYSPVGRGLASSTDPETWGTLNEALHAVSTLRADGVGIVFNGDGLGGDDLDGCRDPETGEIASWAQNIIARFASYAEVSPSGTGVKVYALDAPAELPANIIDKPGPAINGKAPKAETFVTAKYFAVTGRILDGVPDEIVGAGEAWDLTVAELREHGENKDHGERIVGTATGETEMSDILKKALGTDTHLKALWAEGTKDGTDRSRNDAALAAALGDRGFDDVDVEAALRAYPRGQVHDTHDDRQVGRLLGIAAKARERYDEAEYDRLEREAIQAEPENEVPPAGGSSPRPPGAEALAPPTWRTLADIDNAPPGDLLFGMVEPEASTLIYGPGGVGKGTTCAWLIQQCHAAGIRPLVYDAESHPREWRRRTEGLGVPPDYVVYVEPHELPQGVIGKPLHNVAPYLGTIANAASCGFLIVDSILAAANLSEEGLKSNAAAPYLYTRALGELGIPSLSIGHPSKASPEGDPYGSVSWVNAMRLTWLGTRAEGEGHRVRWRPRKWNDRGEIPAIQLAFSYDGDRLSGVEQLDDERTTREWITTALVAGPLTVEELAENVLAEAGDFSEALVSRTKDRIRLTLHRMKRKSLVHKTSKKRGAPWALGDGKK